MIRALMLVAVLASSALGGAVDGDGAPEMDPGGAVAGLAFLTGALLLVLNRRRGG